MSKNPALVVMAAGLGSRFGGLKQITPLGDRGELIMDFSLFDAIRSGFSEAIFIIKEEHERDFRDKLDGGAGKWLKISYAHQSLNDIPEGFSIPPGREKPWGTGQAVLSAQPLVDGPFAVINADDYYGRGAFKEMHVFLSSVKDDVKYNYAMVAYELEKTLSENGSVARGICRVSGDQKLVSITERTQIEKRGDKICYKDDGEDVWHILSPKTPVSMNFWGFTPSIMSELEAGFPRFLENALKNNPLKGEYFLPEVVGSLLSNGCADVTVLNSRDKWYGVTHKEDKDGVSDALNGLKASGLYPDDLWKLNPKEVEVKEQLTEQ